MPRLALPSPRHSSTEPVLTALEAGVPTWPIEPDSRQQKETGCEERRPDRPGNGYPSPPMSESASPPHRVLRAIPEDAQSPPFSREHSSADFILPPSSRTFNPSSSAHVGPTLPSISEITRERRQHSAPPGSHPFASKYRRALLDEPVGLRTSSASPNRHHDAHKHPISPSSPYSANVAWQNAPSIIQPPWKNARSPRRAKSHVASACVNCKRAHLSCDVQRPCTRCVGSGRQVSPS